MGPWWSWASASPIDLQKDFPKAVRVMDTSPLSFPKTKGIQMQRTSRAEEKAAWVASLLHLPKPKDVMSFDRQQGALLSSIVFPPWCLSSFEEADDIPIPGIKLCLYKMLFLGSTRLPHLYQHIALWYRFPTVTLVTDSNHFINAFSLAWVGSFHLLLCSFVLNAFANIVFPIVMWTTYQ